MGMDMDMGMDLGIAMDMDMANTWIPSALDPDPEQWVSAEGDGLMESTQEFGLEPDIF